MELKSTTIEIKPHKFEVYHKDCKHKEELGLEDTAYWSSTEFNSSYAWYYVFSSGYSYGSNKGYTYSVIAVRTI